MRLIPFKALINSEIITFRFYTHRYFNSISILYCEPIKNDSYRIMITVFIHISPSRPSIKIFVHASAGKLWNANEIMDALNKFNYDRDVND